MVTSQIEYLSQNSPFWDFWCKKWNARGNQAFSGTLPTSLSNRISVPEQPILGFLVQEVEREGQPGHLWGPPNLSCTFRGIKRPQTVNISLVSIQCRESVCEDPQLYSPSVFLTRCFIRHTDVIILEVSLRSPTDFHYSNFVCQIQVKCHHEYCALLGYYAASTGNALPTFRDNLA